MVTQVKKIHINVNKKKLKTGIHLQTNTIMHVWKQLKVKGSKVLIQFKKKRMNRFDAINGIEDYKLLPAEFTSKGDDNYDTSIFSLAANFVDHVPMDTDFSFFSRFQKGFRIKMTGVYSIKI